MLEYNVIVFISVFAFFGMIKIIGEEYLFKAHLERLSPAQNRIVRYISSILAISFAFIGVLLLIKGMIELRDGVFIAVLIFLATAQFVGNEFYMEKTLNRFSRNTGYVLKGAFNVLFIIMAILLVWYVY